MLGVAPTGGFGRTDVGRRHAESFPEGVIEVGYVIEATCVGDAGYPVVAGEVVSEPVPAFPAAACSRNWCPAHAAPSGSSGWTSSGERRRRPVRDRGYSRGGKQTAQSPRAEAREASCRHPGDARSPAADCRCSPRADRRRRVSAHGFPWTIRPDRTAGWRRMVQRAQGHAVDVLQDGQRLFDRGRRQVGDDSAHASRKADFHRAAAVYDGDIPGRTRIRRCSSWVISAVPSICQLTR